MPVNNKTLTLCITSYLFKKTKMRIIRLVYRKVIDAATTGAWEKMVWEDTYTEFLMQAQLYNQDKTKNNFSELLQVPGADKLHFLVSAAAVGYITQLNGLLPDIQNNTGRHFLHFSNFRFEIINSSVNNKTMHQVAINFFSEPLIWQDTIGDLLLVSPANGIEASNAEEVLTEMFKLPPFLSIYSIANKE
jgi:hypothetical protein